MARIYIPSLYTIKRRKMEGEVLTCFFKNNSGIEKEPRQLSAAALFCMQTQESCPLFPITGF
jgi:hypothetical protein